MSVVSLLRTVGVQYYKSSTVCIQRIILLKTLDNHLALLTPSVCGSGAQYLTGVQPTLEGEAAFLDVEREVVDVERARRDHLDGLVVAYQSVVCHVDVRYVWRLPHVHAAGQRQQ